MVFVKTELGVFKSTKTVREASCFSLMHSQLTKIFVDRIF